MNRLIPFSGPIILSACVLLFAMLNFQNFISETSTHSAATKNSRETPVSNQPSASVTAQRPSVFYKAVTDRPIFESTRRPFVAEAESDTPAIDVIVQKDDAQILPDNISVFGILKSNQGGTALIAIDGGERRWLKVNDKLSGWTLSEISSEWVKIKRLDDEKTIWLYDVN